MENLAPQEDRLPKKSHRLDKEPPDTGDTFLNRMDIEVISKATETSPGLISYSDTLLKENPTDHSIDEEIMDEEDVKVFEDDVVRGIVDGLISIDFSDRVQAIANKSFDQTVMVKLLGRRIGYTTLRNKLYDLWKPSQPFHLMDIETITSLFVAKLFPRRIVAWIRLPGLLITLYKRSLITEIGEYIGKVVKIDYQIETGHRGHFARMAVSVDLGKSLTSKLLINGRVQIVEYKSRPTICFSCGRYGHVKYICLENTVEDQQEYASPKEQVTEAQLSNVNQNPNPSDRGWS
ncbi:uncharacterized protein LOC120168313 [Hibiscus syriacus]|uniref:uncharacterized protein LOC120168313 n=1 Tax=Hibiscus syriacus TaxID=106335 RepID=UPI0019215967|nr:uncharacterized protein LOC120168313 [Hibiscus syriacus]